MYEFQQVLRSGEKQMGGRNQEGSAILRKQPLVGV